jgi:hypothetical protein
VAEVVAAAAAAWDIDHVRRWHVGAPPLVAILSAPNKENWDIT